jgi:hypothetical protein
MGILRSRELDPGVRALPCDAQNRNAECTPLPSVSRTIALGCPDHTHLMEPALAHGRSLHNIVVNQGE